MTGDAIKIVVYTGDPPKDPLLAGQVRAAGASLDVQPIRDTWQGYVDIYNQMFELYGRKISIEFLPGTGAGSDTAAAKADAIAIADKKPFAVMGGPPSRSTVFADELAHRGVMCLGNCALAVPQKVLRPEQAVPAHRTGRRPEQAARSRPSSSASRPGRARREFAGDDATKNKKRGVRHRPLRHARRPVQGPVRHAEGAAEEEQDRGEGRPSFFLDLSQAQENARTIITKLKDAGVTT